jgi:hypothetical protein
MDKTLVAGYVSFTAICLVLAVSGFWSLSNVKTMPDAELIKLMAQTAHGSNARANLQESTICASFVFVLPLTYKNRASNKFLG